MKRVKSLLKEIKKNLEWSANAILDKATVSGSDEK